MNPENLGQVIDIGQKIKELDAEIRCLEGYYGKNKSQWIEFKDNRTMFLDSEDIYALITNRRNKRENLMKELEKL